MIKRLEIFNKKNGISFFFFLFLWVLILTVNGTIQSGFHFIDDHEILNWNEQLKSKCFTNVLTHLLQKDFTIRFRALYIIHRLVEVCLFHTNFFAWSVYTAFLISLASFFFYKFCHTVGFTFSQALIFPLLVLMGSQGAIAWRLGPNETIGIVFLASSLWLMGLSIYSGSQRSFEILFVCSVFLMSLCKESFVLFIPAILFWKVMLHSEKTTSGFTQSIESNWITITILTIIFLFEIIIITQYVGTNKISYAGVDKDFPLIAFLRDTIYFLRTNGFTFLILAGVCVLIISFDRNIYQRIITLITNLFPLILLWILIVVPQLILYHKSGIYERYYVPATVGFAYCIMYIFKRIDASNNRTIILKRFYLGCIILFLVFQIKDMSASAKAFGDEGKAINAFLKTIDRLNNKEAVLFVLDPSLQYEYAFSLHQYFNSVMKKNNDYFYPISVPLTKVELLEASFQKSFNSKIVEGIPDFKKIQCIGIFPDMELSFLKRNKGFNPQLFQKKLFGRYILYVRSSLTLR